MQVRVPFLAALAALASSLVWGPVMAQPITSASAGADCFRRAPAGDRDGYAWLAAPCSGQAAADLYPDGLAGGPPVSIPPASYSPPAPTYRADAAAGYDPAPPVNPPPGYGGFDAPPPIPYSAPSYQGSTYSSADYASGGYSAQAYGPAPAYASAPPQAFYPPNDAPGYGSSSYQVPSYSGSGYATADYAAPAYEAAPAYPAPAEPPPPAYASAPRQAVYEPNRAPYYAGNIVSAPAPVPAAPIDQGYAATASIDIAPAYAPPAPGPDYGPPPLPGHRYGPDDCAMTSGALAGGGSWRRQDCRAAGGGGSAYAGQAYAPAPQPPPVPDDRGYAANSSYAYGAAGNGRQAYVSSGGYTYDAPGVLPGYAPGQCAGSAGSAANGRVQYQAQTCERSSSQAYSYTSGSGGFYAGGSGAIQGDNPHWGVAGRGPDGFLTWPGKVGN